MNLYIEKKEIVVIHFMYQHILKVIETPNTVNNDPNLQSNVNSIILLINYLYKKIKPFLIKVL